MDVERIRQLILEIIRVIQQANNISQNEMEDIISDEVMYYDDGNQAFNTYMVKAQDQNDAINKAHHRFEKAHPNMSCMIQSIEKAGG